jgi:hypothetical protein
MNSLVPCCDHKEQGDFARLRGDLIDRRAAHPNRAILEIGCAEESTERLREG